MIPEVPKLYLIATPIGNLGDITLRALETLKSLDVLYAEDKRVTSKLLANFDIRVSKLKTYQHHSSEAVKQAVIQDLLQNNSVGVVTDAGTPGISDPGNELIDYVLKNYPRTADLEIVPIPGASALTAALSVSGFNMNKFVFLGFLPKKKRTKLFTWLKEGGMSFVFYESPFRLLKSLEVVNQFFGNVNVCVARELTKMHETVYRGSLKDVLVQLTDSKIKGEVVVLVELS